MGVLVGITKAIDTVLIVCGRFASWGMIALMAIVVYDVVTRYFGVPKPFGLNSTQIQESQYWVHTVMFALVIGFAYKRQTHVRIDLVRDMLPMRVKYMIEGIGASLLCVVAYLMIPIHNNYALASFKSGEASKSVIGLTNIWILKAFLMALFVLLLAAAISQLIKAALGFAGKLPEDMVPETVGGDL